MYKALLESSLGTNYIPGHGFDNSTREGSFSLGVTGASSGSLKEVEKVIFQTLFEVMENGLDPQLIESAIHQIEVRHKEVNPNFGLSLISSMIPYALHGNDVTVPLQLNEFVRRLKKEQAEGVPIFSDLIRKYLWDNPHK
jgi:Zn-dependent M16 (insulinase) family peptidase